MRCDMKATLMEFMYTLNSVNVEEVACLSISDLLHEQNWTTRPQGS